MGASDFLSSDCCHLFHCLLVASPSSVLENERTCWLLADVATSMLICFGMFVIDPMLVVLLPVPILLVLTGRIASCVRRRVIFDTDAMINVWYIVALIALV